jgi:hypothetical protein
MKKGKKYFIECKESDYLFVREKLIEMGFKEFSCCGWHITNNGVCVCTDGDFFPLANPYAPYETLTLEQFKHK